MASQPGPRSAPCFHLDLHQAMSKAFARHWLMEWAIHRVAVVCLACCFSLCLARVKGRDLDRIVAAGLFAARFSLATDSAVVVIFDSARFAIAAAIATDPVIVVVAAVADFAAKTGSACFSGRSFADLYLFFAGAIAEAALVFPCDVSSIARSFSLLLPNLPSQPRHRV